MIDYVTAIRRDATALVELCGRDPRRPVPSCPDWTAAELEAHIVDTFRGAIPGFGPDPVDGQGAVEQAVVLLERDSAPARDVAHECAVHRWDACRAFDLEYSIEPELACDGVDEFFDAAWPMLLDYLKRPAGVGETLRLERADGPQRWSVLLGERPVVTHEDRPGDVEVRGSASDLVLWLWGRTDPPDVRGDRAVLESMRNPLGRFLSPGF